MSILVEPPAQRGSLALLTATLLLAACTKDVDLHSSLPEAEANEVLAELIRNGIEANKRAGKQGFTITVPSTRLADAATLLRAHGLPRQRYAGMGDVFRKDGMISTPTEERGRYVYALSQELEKTISQIDGVVLVRVHPVLPERIAPGEPVSPSSCAVLVKHRPGWAPQLYEDKIRRLVAAGIPGLSMLACSKISVVFVQADAAAEPSAAKVEAQPPADDNPPRRALWPLLALGAALIVAAGGWARPHMFSHLLTRWTRRFRRQPGP